MRDPCLDSAEVAAAQDIARRPACELQRHTNGRHHEKQRPYQLAAALGEESAGSAELQIPMAWG